jgi:small subunit ribosomal protein S18
MDEPTSALDVESEAQVVASLFALMRGRTTLMVAHRLTTIRRVDKVLVVDYKDVRRLRNFVTDRGKIIPRRTSGNCAVHQRQLTAAIKRARSIALLPFAADLG